MELKIPVIVIFGPTAVGKTAFLLNFNKISEIINLDSIQVYKYIDIGSAKPDIVTREKIKHHLVDFLDLSEEFNAADFKDAADKLCTEIYNRGKVPLISGGNAFFLKNFIYGLSETPKSDPDVRKTVAKRLEKEGLETLYKELEEKDPSYAKKIGKNDVYRITRALEVFYTSNRPVSSFKIPSEKRKKYDFFLIGLNRPREELYERINNRVEDMFASGLYEEFKKLQQAGYSEKDPGMSAIGYKEFFNLEKDNNCTIEDIKEAIKQNTRHYAKRQITFFGKIDNVLWENPSNADIVLNQISQFLAPYDKKL